MKTIALIQLKGGTGRSTIATTLAVLLSKSQKVLLVDCEAPQYSSDSWYAVRDAGRRSENLRCVRAESHEQMLDAWSRAKEEGADVVILDCAPRLEQKNRAALMLSDLVLVPITSSITDVWATQDVGALLAKAMEVRPEIRVRVVWNRFKASTKVAASIAKALPDVFPHPSLRAVLKDRVAYVEAFGQGCAVTETSAPAVAKKEAEALAAEVVKTLKD